MTSNAEHPDQFHAAVVEEFNKDLNLKDIDLPEPGPNEALVKVLTSGVCHTDLHAAQGGLADQARSALRPRPRGRG